ncbi:TrbM/KikA/MpfK family conjugal transfer protein [Massilia sp. CCM 9210]|uniref:TrbM/KikA/MpfK family conjugal transfer protein n=1 Tax=Massilia scottii TaxID=3057166 RepID=UPI002796D0BA|nr:TrbM/KikA/MpfK family conjugal transfer protein [Massilia sp. CCM 9210]MDQ1815793.1 TrbM/KikA/MpfK family conjugal transfer protein [Massilia sp. CCM 9210]
MQHKKLYASIAFAAAGFGFVAPAQAQELNADAKLACEMTLCLLAKAKGDNPSECLEPIKKYFDIRAKKFKDTLKARTNFLKLCPRNSGQASSDDNPSPEMLAESSTPVYPDPVEEPVPAPGVPGTVPGVVYTPDTKEAIKAEIARLMPIWDAQAVLSVAARTVVETCVQLNGRVQDGYCKAEMADYDAKRLPTIASREEIYRLQAILASMP